MEVVIAISGSLSPSRIVKEALDGIRAEPPFMPGLTGSHRHRCLCWSERGKMPHPVVEVDVKVIKFLSIFKDSGHRRYE